jgi:c(7)-type cytochrome triheme protein
MKYRWLIVALLVLLPSAVCARWIKDQVVMPVEATGPVVFSHNNHLEAVGKNCPSCHNAIFDIVVKKNPVFTMADMAQGKSCGACHNGTRAFSVKDDCSMCHPTRDIVFKVPDAGDANFSHEVHTGMYGCGECHPGIFKPAQGKNTATMTQMEGGRSCGACHDGNTAFTVQENCDTCHAM